MMTAKHTRHSRRSCFVISAEGGCDELSPGTAGSSAEQDARAEQWSEAGIQFKYASGVVGHNRGEAAPFDTRITAGIQSNIRPA